ncbi:protein FAM186A isoform X1 [Canis lupus dingo]|uniref:protein FAM186A isoform X1 n=3 Tax=Canis lupus dingo TaxID=286419 RepID=UPI000DC66EDB|nr:protein FAM186A isoform X1 [Canis lupus dingo]
MQSQIDSESESEKEVADSTIMYRKAFYKSEVPELEIPFAVQDIISRIEQAQLHRAREDINIQLNDILLNVQRIINRYTLDENVHSGKKISLIEHKKRRIYFLEKIVTYAKNAEIREKILVYILAWLEEWNLILSEITAMDIEEHHHWIAQMEFLPETFKAIESNVKILSRISVSLFEERKRQKKRTTSRGTLWKSWKERVIKRPATAHALRPDQMISDEFATNTKVSEIQDMLQELINTTMFNKLENNAIKYISSTIVNLSKALSTLTDELKVFNLQSASMYINETNEKEKELSLKIMRELSENNEMLQQKLRDAEEKYEYLIRSKGVVQPRGGTALPTSPLNVLPELSSQSSIAISKADREDSTDDILVKEFENILDEAQTKGTKGLGIKWNSTISYTAPVEITPDLTEEQYPLPEKKQKEASEDKISLKKGDIHQKDGTDQHQSQKKKQTKGPYTHETSGSNLSDDKSKKKASETKFDHHLELQALEKKRKEIKSFSEAKSKPSTESKSQHVLADYPTDTKSQHGKGGTSSLWEQLRKVKPEYSQDRSQISSENKEEPTTESGDKEGMSEMSSQEEQFRLTQLGYSPQKVKTKGKKHQDPPATITSKQGKLEEDMLVFTKKVKSHRLVKSQSRVTEETSESTRVLGSADGKSEESNLEEFQDAIIAFLKEKIDNIGKPLDKKIVPKEELLLKGAEVEKLGIIKAKIEEYFQNVAETVTKTLRKYKDIKNVEQVGEKRMKQKKEVSFMPGLYFQKPISAKPEISTLFSSKSMDPLTDNLIQTILTEIEGERDAPVASTVGRDHREKEKQRQEEYMQEGQEKILGKRLKHQLKEEESFWKKSYEVINKKPQEEESWLQMKVGKQGQQKHKQWQEEEIWKEQQKQRMQKRTEQEEEQMQRKEEEEYQQPKQQKLEAWNEKMEKPVVPLEKEKGQQKEVRYQELEINWKKEKQKPRRNAQDHEGQWQKKPKDQMKINEKNSEEREKMFSQTSMTLFPKWKSIPRVTSQSHQRKEFLGRFKTLHIPADGKHPIPTTPLSTQLPSPEAFPISGHSPTGFPTLTPQQAQAPGITVTSQKAEEALGITVAPEQAQAPGITLTPEQAQALGITLTPQQAQERGITLTPQQAQELGITLTPQQAQERGITLTPQQAQTLGITLTRQQVQTLGITPTPQQAQERGITLTPEQAQALGITLTPQQAQERGITLTPQQAQTLGITLTRQQVQTLGITPTPQQAQERGITLTPEQAQALGITLTPQQAQEQGITLTPQQAQTLGITLTRQQVQTLGITPTPQQAQERGITLTPEQAQALGITLTPQQAQEQGIILTPQQAQAPGITVTPQQAQPGGITLTPEQIQARRITLTPEQAQTLGISLTPQQAQALGITLTPQQAQEQGIILTPQQAQAPGITLSPQQAQARGITLTPEQIQARRITLTPQQAQTLGITLTPQQAQAGGRTHTPQQAQTLGVTLTPEQAQAQGITLTPEQAQEWGITHTPEQAQAGRITFTPEEAQTLGVTLTPEQAQALGITLTPQQAQALGITLTPEQAQARGITLTPQQAQAGRITLTPEQAQTLGVTLTPEPAQALGITLTPQQAQEQGIILTPQQAQAPGITLSPQQAQAGGITLTPEQIQARRITLTPQQAQTLGITLTPQQAQAGGRTHTPQQAQTLGVTLTPEQAQAQGITLTPEQAQEWGITHTPEQAQAGRITFTPEQDQALGIILSPQQAQALGITLTPQQVQAQGITLTPEQFKALVVTLTPEKCHSLGIRVTPENVQTWGPPLTVAQGWNFRVPLSPENVLVSPVTFTPEQIQGLCAPLSLEQAEALGISVSPEYFWKFGVPLTSDKFHALESPLEQVQPLGAPFIPGQSHPMGITLMSEEVQQSSEQPSPLGAHPPLEHTLKVGIIPVTDKSIIPGASHISKQFPTLAPSSPRSSQRLKASVLPGKSIISSPRQSPASAPISEKSSVFEVFSTPLQISRSPLSQAPGKLLGMRIPPDPGKLLAPQTFPSSKQSLVSEGQSTSVQSVPPKVPLPPGKLPTGEDLPTSGQPLTLETLLSPRKFFTSWSPQLPMISESPFALREPLLSGTPLSSAQMPSLLAPLSPRKPFVPGPSSTLEEFLEPRPLTHFEEPQAFQPPATCEQSPYLRVPSTLEQHQASPLWIPPIPGHPPALWTSLNRGKPQKDMSSSVSKETFQSYLTNYRTAVSQIPYIGGRALPSLMKPLTTKLPKTSQISSKWDQKTQFPPIDKSWILTSDSVTKKHKMMVPPSSSQEFKEQRYFVDVEAQRKNLTLLNQATKSFGLPSQLHTTAANLIIETLHTDRVRLGYLFRKYIAYRLIQRARNNIIRRLQAVQNTGKGYETQNLYIMLSRIDDYQKKVMQVWTDKQKSLEQKRNQCLRNTMSLFSQLQMMYKLNLRQPIPLIIDKKQIPASTEFVQQPFLELLIEEDRKSDTFKKFRQDQMGAIWNTDLSTSSYPITEKTSIHLLWAQLGGYPDIPMLLQLDVQSTFRKSLASIKSRFKKIPK